MRFHIAVQRWASYTEECGWRSNVASDPPTLPLNLRRRATTIGQKLLACAIAVLPQNGDPIPSVLSSRHGEYARTLSLLQQLAESDSVSPADFSMAIHHGLAGLLSIHMKNRAAVIAVSAGADSFGYGMLEAQLHLQEHGAPVLLLHFDEPLPSIYDSIVQSNERQVAFAALIDVDGPDRFLVQGDWVVPGEHTNATDVAGTFANFIAGKQANTYALGDRLNWRWLRDG